MISIVLPAYNEEGQLKESVARIRSAIQAEVIIVDDGSTDGTRAEASAIPGVKVVSYSRNQGKGYAIRAGVARATGNIVLCLDSGSEIDTRHLDEYVEALKGADLAIASKWHPQSKVQTLAMRRFLSLGFQMCVRLLTGVEVRDTQTGLKAFRAETMKKIVPLLAVKRYAFDVEILVVAKLLKARVVELPVTLKLEARFSLKDVLRMGLDLLGIAYRLRVRRSYQRSLRCAN